MLQGQQNESLLVDSVLVEHFFICDGLFTYGQGHVIRREGLRFLSEHVAAELVEEKNRSQSSISVQWPTRVLPRDVIFVVGEEVLPNLLVQLGRVLDIEPAAPEDLVVGAGDAIPILRVPKVEDCVDSCALLRRDRFRRSTE